MGSIGYRHQKCKCVYGSVIDNDNLIYTPSDNETGTKTIICNRCFCLTDETLYVHVDKNLQGPKGSCGKSGEWHE